MAQGSGKGQTRTGLEAGDGEWAKERNMCVQYVLDPHARVYLTCVRHVQAGDSHECVHTHYLLNAVFH